MLQKISQIRESISAIQAMHERLDDLEAYTELLSEEENPDSSSLKELDTDTEKFTKDLNRLDMETLLSGEHDSYDAFMEIKAGAGGTDACDWVAMLQKMYLRWAENSVYKCEILDETEADLAGFKNTTLLIHGKNAFGYLKAERGVHRLVRISPFDANKRRQTSFAEVVVYPDLGEEVKVDINPDDLRIDYYRSSGAGGQHVNKTESAVRLTHLPTGLVVTCQNERSQHKNKAMAMKVLQSRLMDLEQRQQEEREAVLKGASKANEWGSQDRSYVMQPYTMVKDLRTGYETGDIIGVLNGDIGPFLDAFLLWQRQRQQQPTA